MDKAITTALLIVISTVMAIMLYNAAYPAILEGGDAIASMADRAQERMRSDVSIIYAAYDTPSSEVRVWVRNTGLVSVQNPQQIEVFFGPQGAVQRIPGSGSTCGLVVQAEPVTSSVLNPTPTPLPMGPSSTYRITIGGCGALASGSYLVRVVLPSGVADEYVMSL